jgi:pyridoxamine 5'-phosphate oxidase
MGLEMPESPPVREVDADADALAQFRRWYAEAEAAEPDPETMTLATATGQGRPSARMVFLRGFDERGFVFFTNYNSRKAGEMAGNPHAALLFYWRGLGRQVRIEGRVEMVSAAESDAYFRRRPRGSQLSAWASPQSQPIPSREFLLERIGQLSAEYALEVPRPPFWGGYRVVPETIEFWQRGDNRMHDRLFYRRTSEGWLRQRLGP